MVIMIAFGIASIMLLVGVFLRAKVGFLQNMLVPSAVIAGVLGLVFMNVADSLGIGVGATAGDFTKIVNQLFVVAFISITLMNSSEEEEAAKQDKGFMKGAWAIGLIWCLLFTLTPLISTFVTMLFQDSLGISPIYGMLVQFAFCMGPGQSSTYGTLIEGYGWNDAVMVALTLSALGFLVAYLVGIPAAKTGIRKGFAKHNSNIDEKILRGYLKEHEQTEMMKKSTTCNSNIESMTFHFAIIGLCYILAIGISKILAFLPGYIGTSMSSLMFLNGMYAAWIVKFIMKKLHISYFLDDSMQNKITGWGADYLVVCSFMSVSIKVVSKWLVPILLVALVSTFLTVVICFYFGERIGSSHDFERTLGMYGMCTGTAPTGISLIRIADPNFKTLASVELGASNPFCNIFNIPTYLLILGYAAGSIPLNITLLSLAGLVVVFFVALKLTGCWGKKRTFALFRDV